MKTEKINEDIFAEVRDVLGEGQDELIEEKKVFFDKNANQFSIKIPKSFSLKSELHPDSNFAIIFNPKKEETLELMKISKMVIFLKGARDESKKKKS